MCSKHILDNFVVTEWCRLIDCAKFNEIPFGVYAITEPTEKIPPSTVKPFEYDRTVYFGKSGSSYNEFFYDRKQVTNKLHVVGEQVHIQTKENFHRYGYPARRLKDHRHNIINRNIEIDRETSYTKFFESFGYGEDVVSKVNVCMIVPEYEIADYTVKAWLSAIESCLILRFQNNFGRNTLMNVDHDTGYRPNLIEDSHSFRKSKGVKAGDLFRFTNG